MIIGTVRPEEARIHDTWEGFHSFTSTPEGDDLSTREPYGSFEIFFGEQVECPECGDWSSEKACECEDTSGLRRNYLKGWFWWPCFPGCLPDGEPMGPFASSRQALEDADEWHPEFDDA